MAPDRVYPDMGYAPSAPPPTGTYDNVNFKDQPLPPPATYRAPGRKRGRNPCCCLLKWLCGVLAILIVLIGIAVLLFWFIVEPRSPKYNVQDLRISGLNSFTGSAVTTNATYKITARNPNKKIGFYYDDIDVNVQLNGLTIGDGSIPSFYQGHKNTTIIDGEVGAQGVVVNSDTLALLTGSNAQKVPLYVKVDLKVRVKIGSWKSRKVSLKVECNIDVNLTASTGQTQLVSQHCKVKK